MRVNLYGMFFKNVSFSSRVTTFGLFSATRKQFFSIDQSNIIKERKINVDGININYLKVGSGEHAVLFMPALGGTVWTNFKPQIDGLDRRKFTLIAWDPPGYGKSRPPDRSFPKDYLQRDATWAYNLMQRLGYPKYSLLGWSNGGVASMIFASMFPDSIRRLILIATVSYITPEDIDIYLKLKNINTLSEKVRTPLIAVYGEEYYQNIWHGWYEANLKVYHEQNGDLCKQHLANIKCPTLIVHGNKDPLVSSKHPVYLKNHIADARVEYFDNGVHSVHLQYPEKFNDLFTRFLTE